MVGNGEKICANLGSYCWTLRARVKTDTKRRSDLQLDSVQGPKWARGSLPKLCLHYTTLLRACWRYFHECGFGLQAAQIWESCIYTAEDTCVIRWMIMNNWLIWLPEMPQSQSNRTESGLAGGARLCQRLLGASIWGCESSSKFFQWSEMLHDSSH